MSTPAPKRYGPIAPIPPEGQIDLLTLFSTPGPIEIDVGFGRGMSLLERAKVAPDARIVGLEIKKKWATLVKERCERHGLSHVVVFAADVIDFFSRAGPDGCVTKISVQFPDPWWKKRHRKRLVVREPFLDHAQRLLADQGQLFVQTDVEERFEDYWRLIESHPAFEAPRRIGENPFGAVSNRERRATDDGLPVYRLIAARHPR